MVLTNLTKQKKQNAQRNKDQLSLTNRAMHCIMTNMLQTNKVDAQCNKLATKLS